MIRTALTRLPNRSPRSASSVWMAALCPRPSSSTICSASAMPWSVEPARSTARTGQSFSPVNGSDGPTPESSASRMEVSSGTEKPATTWSTSPG